MPMLLVFLNHQHSSLTRAGAVSLVSQATQTSISGGFAMPQPEQMTRRCSRLVACGCSCGAMGASHTTHLDDFRGTLFWQYRHWPNCIEKQRNSNQDKRQLVSAHTEISWRCRTSFNGMGSFSACTDTYTVILFSCLCRSSSTLGSVMYATVTTSMSVLLQ